MFIHQKNQWYHFIWDSHKIASLLGNVRHFQGRLLGKMESLGFSLQDEAMLTTLTLDVLKSTEIEGEFLNKDQVRSSIARKLGIEVSGMIASSRHVEGVVEMMMDATHNYSIPLNQERLYGWHNALFPTGYSGAYKIEVAQYRTGEMQVVSGAMGRECIHYEAPKPERIAEEMEQFLVWFNQDQSTDAVLKAAIAHFWFITIHPFDDGNGRIARAITDMLLARSDHSSRR